MKMMMSREDKSMTGKNIAVFGIYPHRASVEYAVSALKIGGVRDTGISGLLQEKPWDRRNPQKRRKGQPLAQVRGQLSEERLAGWRELGRLQFPAWGLSSSPALLSPHWRESESAARWVALQEHSWGWKYLNMKPSDIKGASRTAASCCPCIVM